MKFTKFLMLFLLIFTPLLLIAQSSNKYVRTSMLPNGTLFFVNPLELHNNQAKLSIDFTYPYYQNQKSDSVTINFSLFTEQPILQVVSLEFTNLNFNILANNFTKFFVEKNKSKWHNRYSTKISIIDFNKILDSTTKLNISITDNNKNLYPFETNKTWEKMSKITKELIMVNK